MLFRSPPFHEPRRSTSGNRSRATSGNRSRATSGNPSRATSGNPAAALPGNRYSALPGNRYSALLLVMAALAAGASGCTTDETTTTTATDDTTSTAAVLIRPAQFLGNTPCSAAPGALRSYVVTLIDRTNPELPFTLASSLPTPCSQGVRFDDIVGGHVYTAQIDGYEAFADEICTVGCLKTDGSKNYTALRSGSRHMEILVPATADTKAHVEPVAPRWLGSCGELDSEPTIARLDGTTLILECDPLVDGAPGSTPTTVEVDPRAALGDLACVGSAAAGEPSVATFDIESSQGFGNILGAPCDDAEPFLQTYSGAKLVPETGVDFFIGAHAQKGGPLTWGATCSAIVKDGLTVRAACAPLSDKGALHVDVGSALDLFGVSCSGDIVSYDATLEGPSVEVEKLDVSCKNDLSFGALSPGEYTADLVIHTSDGGDLFSAKCTATVDPGRDATAACILQ